MKRIALFSVAVVLLLAWNASGFANPGGQPHEPHPQLSPPGTRNRRAWRRPARRQASAIRAAVQRKHQKHRDHQNREFA